MTDNCEICGGTRGGVPGNENIIEFEGDKVVMCDSCHANHMEFPGFWKETRCWAPADVMLAKIDKLAHMLADLREDLHNHIWDCIGKLTREKY